MSEFPGPPNDQGNPAAAIPVYIAGASDGKGGVVAPTDGQLLIGNSKTEGFDLATLTAGSGIKIDNGEGTIKITADSVPGSGTVTSVDVAGGKSGLKFSGGPVTGAGTITIADGSVVAADFGGTGANTLTLNGVLIGNGTSPISAVGPDKGTGLPLLSAGDKAAPAFGALNLAGSGVTGTLAPANGGTGITNDPTVILIPYVIDGGGSVITTGIKGSLPPMPFAGQIQEVTLLGDQTGSIVIEVWKCTYAAYDPPTTPTTANKINASAPPTISAAKKSADATLTGWDKDVAVNDILTFNVNSVTNLQRVTLGIKFKRT